MVAAGIGLIIAGLLVGLLLGPFGFIVAAVGLVLLVLALVGLGRRSAQGSP